MVAAGGNVPARLLQGRREVGAHLPGHRRRPLLVPRRPRHGRRGRFAHPPRAGQPGDQHRRREGLPRGGRGGRQAGGRVSTTAWSSACPTTDSARPSPRSSPSPGATTDESAIITAVKQHLAGYKAPKRSSSSRRCPAPQRQGRLPHGTRPGARLALAGASAAPGASGAAASHPRHGPAPEADLGASGRPRGHLARLRLTHGTDPARSRWAGGLGAEAADGGQGALGELLGADAERVDVGTVVAIAPWR